MLFGKHESASHARLGIMLASHSVELFVTLIDATGKPRIIYQTGKPIEINADVKPLLASLTDALTLACDELVNEGLTHIVSKSIAKGHFDSVEVFYGAPWYLSRGRHVIVERSQDTPLTEASLKQLVTTYTNGLLPEGMGQAIVLEEHAQGFTVNGYPVEHPIGTTGKEVGMWLYVSAIDGATKDAVEQVIHHSFHAHEIIHQSILLPVISALGTMRKDDNDYVFVEVSGHVTEISKIERGIIIDTVSIPEGYETTTEKTADGIGKETHELKTMLQRPDDFGLTAEFDESRNDALISWVNAYGSALQNLGIIGMPGTTVLVADTPLQASYKREIARVAGGTVQVVSKDAYSALYDPAARPRAGTLPALLALAMAARH